VSQETEVDASEHINELSGSINGGKFVDQSSDC
jgi:hypothetical protein